MTRFAIHLRLITALAVLLAIASLITAPTVAQETAATPVAEAEQPPVEAPAPSDAPPADPAPEADAAADPTPEADAESEEAAPEPVSADDTGFEAAVEIEAQAVDVDVVVAAFDCAVAPVAIVPGVVPAECTAAEGVSFSATADGAGLGTFTTDATGTVTVPVPDGAVLVIDEDESTVTPGFDPAGTGTESLTVVGGGALSLVHIAEDVIPDPVVENPGRLQLSQGSCPTLGEERTEIRYIPPESLQAQADGEGCGGVEGAEFLIEGGTFPAGGEIKTTDANGNWRGEVSAGTYTVTDVSSGQSLEIEVVFDEITVVVAIDYVPQVAGTLSVSRFICDADEDITEVTVATAEPAPREGCEAQDGNFQIDDKEPFTGSGDGAVTFQIPIGTYEFSDLTVGVGTSTEIQIAEGATTFVLVERLVTLGDVSAAYSFCDDPASANGDPNDPAYWAAACGSPISDAGLRLLDVAGAVVAEAMTDDDGIATFTNIADGTYRIRGGGDRATCAVFVGDQGALSGFQVSTGELVQSQVFGCTKSAGNPGGENPGGENPGTGAPGDGTGNPPNGAPGTGANPVPNQLVTQLPSTGVSTATSSGPGGLLWAGVAAMLALIVAGSAVGFRRQE